MSSSLSRRTLVTGAAGSALAVAMPAIVRAQADTIRIGHLTPVTGFLGTLGEYAQMAIRLALDDVEEAFHKMERGEVLRSVVVL